MAFKDTDINICSRAMNAIGADSITSFSEGTTEAKVANQKYEICKQKLLSIYPWAFNRAEIFVPRLPNNRETKFTYIYEKPEDCLNVRAVKENGIPVDYSFDLGKINTNAEKPILVYSADYQEKDMPAYFVALLIDLCARDFLIPVTGKYDEYKMYDNIYQNSLAEAKNVDAKSKTPSCVDTTLILGER